jgi:hypothetical protein
MNGGLLGGLGVQPLKTQRMFNTPYGTTITIPPNSYTSFLPSQNTLIPFDQPGFQIKDAATNKRAFHISTENNSGQRNIVFQSRISPSGAIIWQGSDRTATLFFNIYIGTNVYYNTSNFSSTTIGGIRFQAMNGNATINHFSLWDDGQSTADVMAQRNSTAAQAFRLYNTFTSLTNYERFTLDWQTKPNTLVIATSSNSLSGTRGMEFRIGATTAMSILSTAAINVNSETSFVNESTTLSSVALTTPFLTGSNTFVLANNNLQANEPVFFSTFASSNYNVRLFQTYYVVNRTTNNFQVALSASGDPITFSGSVFSGGTLQRAFGSPRTNWLANGSTATTNKQVGFKAYSVPVYGATNPSSQWLLKATIDGVEQDLPKIRADSGGGVTITGTTGNTRILTLNHPDASLSDAAYFSIGGSNNISWNGPFQCGSYIFLSDTVGGGNGVSIRSLGNAQMDIYSSTTSHAFRVYNTFTSTTNYERFTIDWQTNPNTCVIGTSAGGVGGFARGMEFRVGANTLMTLASANNNISLFSNDQTYNGGSRIMFISDATAAPTANPVNGGYMFVSAGALRYMGSSGTISTIAPA